MSVWGAEFVQLLAAPAVLPRSIWKKRMNSTFSLFKILVLHRTTLKGIASRDFRGLQMILIDRIGVPDVPLKDYIFSNSCFHIVF